MRIFSHVIAGLILLLVFQACTERLICPAYQSAFIHDKDALKRQFSYFGEDSMPKVFEASKDRFLIVEPVSYHRKLRSLQTIAMTDIYPEIEDSTDVADDDFYLAERDIIDSTEMENLADSTYVISLKKEKFNIDQELYLWYLKEYLVYPDVRLMQEQQAMEARAAEGKEEKRGFFKRLFGKKKKKDDETEFDVETNATDIEETGETKEKKGIFNFLKKKKKKDDPEAELEDPDRKNKKNKEEAEEEENSADPEVGND